MALREITDQTDLVLVVGDPKSSNSNRLVEVAIKRNVKAFLINNEEEIKSEWMDGVKIIGLTAGASTPEEVVQKCIQRLIDFRSQGSRRCRVCSRRCSLWFTERSSCCYWQVRYYPKNQKNDIIRVWTIITIHTCP